MNDPLIPVEMEEAVIGAMLFDSNFIDDATAILTRSHFGVPVHGLIFDHIAMAHANGSKSPAYAAIRTLGENRHFLDWGGPAQLMDLMEVSGTALVGAKDFCLSIEEASRARVLRHACDEAYKEMPTDLTAACDLIEAALMDTTGTKATAGEESSAIVMEASLGAIREARDHGGPRGRTAPMMPEWNQLTGTMVDGEMIVLAGRPGMGKTAVALSVASGVASTGCDVLFISLEMKGRELGQRLIADACYGRPGRVSYADLLHGKVTNEGMQTVEACADEIAQLPLTVSSNGSLSVEKVAAMVRRKRRDCERKGRKLGLVVVDYLQRLRTEQRTSGRYEAITHISETLKNIALDNEVPMLTLAQLSRQVESRDDKRPMLSDLRDSGAIEQDADSIIFVYRPEYYLRQCEPDTGDAKYDEWYREMQRCSGKLELLAEKRRNGAAARDWCWFLAEHQAIRDQNHFREQRAAA